MSEEAEKAALYRKHANQLRVMAETASQLWHRLLLLESAADHDRLAQQMDDAAQRKGKATASD